MSAEKTRVMIVTPLGQGGKGGIDRIMDEIRRVATPAAHPELDVSYVTTRGQKHIAFSALYMAAAIGVLWRARRRIDMLHVNLSSHGSTRRKILVCKAARRFGIPYLLHLHGSRFRQYWDGLDAAKAEQVRDMFRHAARILVLGQVWKDYITARVPEAADRIEIVPNATRAPAVDPGPSGAEPTILFLGKVGQRKGVWELIEALAKLPAAGWRAVIAGDGEVAEAAAAIARHPGLSERVELTGWVGPDRVEALLKDADIVVLPSYDENLPMSVIEGMAYGRAVVATPVGAVEDILAHDVTGLLTPVGDADALAANLAALVGDPERRARLGAAAKAFHRAHLDIGPYVDRLSSIWRSVAAEATTPTSGA